MKHILVLLPRDKPHEVITVPLPPIEKDAAFRRWLETLGDPTGT
jgi:hypothetical protein